MVKNALDTYSLLDIGCGCKVANAISQNAQTNLIIYIYYIYIIIYI